MVHVETEDFDVKRDGLVLKGRMEKPSNVFNPPVVIMMHGLRGDLGYDSDSVMAVVSSMLVKEGFRTIRFDFNGCGKSDGAFANLDVYNEIEDAIAVLKYVMGAYNPPEISMLGHSQGGVIAGMTAGMYPDIVHSLALLAPAASLKNDALRGYIQGTAYDTNHIPPTVTFADGAATLEGKYMRIAKTLPVYETTAMFKNPTIVVMGEDDQIVDSSVPRNYAEAMANCSVDLYKDLGHLFTGKDREVAFTEAVQFLATNRTDD